LLVATAVAVTAGGAQANNFTSTLGGANEVPPVAAPGAGIATFSLNDVTLVMSFRIAYQDLQGTTTEAHIHRGAEGENGPAIYSLSDDPFASGYQGHITVDPDDLSDLTGQGLYVNVYTTSFLEGEIRGQILVEQTAVQPGTWGAIKQLFN
jgi:hypothetical protein